MALRAPIDAVRTFCHRSRELLVIGLMIQAAIEGGAEATIEVFM
jgi:hypothetical protein